MNSPGRSLAKAFLTPILLWVSYPGGGGLWPLLFVAFLPILLVGKRENCKSSFVIGFCCGLLHYTLLLYWLVNVLGKYGGLPLFIAVPGLLLFASYMSLYLGLFTGLYSYLWRNFSPLIVLVTAPALWVGLDWFRGVFLTGIPWMDPGYALYNVPELIQPADLTGHHGVTYLILYVNCLLVYLVSREKTLRGIAFTACFTLVLAGGYGAYSVKQLHQFRNVDDAESSGGIKKTASQIRVGIVQGNVDQSVKWSPGLQQSTVEKYLLMTDEVLAKEPVDFVVWPETALPFYPTSSEHTKTLKKYTARTNVPIVTGAPWYEIPGTTLDHIELYNSAFILLPNGSLGGKYYKTHLVPFGEYVPFKDLLFFLAPLVETVGDFSSGTVEHPLRYGQSRIGVLICFESVFPELSRQWVLSGANLLVNLTNDAWYGKSSAPYHSLAMSVFRAVETRRSVVRSANTGISAFISPAGEIRGKSELFVPYSDTRRVTLLEDVTLWVRFGYLFGPLCLGFSLFLLAIRKNFGKRIGVRV